MHQFDTNFEQESSILTLIAASVENGDNRSLAIASQTCPSFLRLIARLVMVATEANVGLL